MEDFRIGDFSLMARVSVKTLRFYQSEGILSPSRIDPHTGYRYYQAAQLETARTITHLKALNFSLAEIKDILQEGQEDEGIETILEQKRREALGQLSRYESLVGDLDAVLGTIRVSDSLRGAKETGLEVKEDCAPSLLVLSTRFKGRYDGVGPHFQRLFRLAGPVIAGKPLSLYHDEEYRDGDADIEACVPVRQERPLRGRARSEESDTEASYRVLPETPCLSTLHRGPYDTIGQAYGRLAQAFADRGLPFQTPSRETYILGPGTIFPRSPSKYLTLIQIPLLSPPKD